MINFIKRLFKPYQGSSEHFKSLYLQAKEEMASENCNINILLRILDILTSKANTQGDARLIIEIQYGVSLKLRAVGKDMR